MKKEERVWKYYPVAVFERQKGQLKQLHWGTDIPSVIFPPLTRAEYLSFICPKGITLEWRDVLDEWGLSDPVWEARFRWLWHAICGEGFRTPGGWQMVYCDEEADDATLASIDHWIKVRAEASQLVNDPSNQQGNPTSDRDSDPVRP